MARNDQAEGPIQGQIVRYQITSTHAIVVGIINRVNTDGTVNICQCPAPGSVTWIDRASVPYGGALDGTATYDNKFGYPEFF